MLNQVSLKLNPKIIKFFGFIFILYFFFSNAGPLWA